MSKRAMGKFARRAQDFYATPAGPVVPLLRHLSPGTVFIEPCAGDGALIRHLTAAGHRCIGAFDIEPKGPGIVQRDTLVDPLCRVALGNAPVITNPPWSRALLHPMIDLFRCGGGCWLLFDSDWMFTKQARPHLAYCRRIIPVGRVSWMDNGTSGFDNCAWYFFGSQACRTAFIPEAAE